ncbi:LuxR C-terminal-related transcriptional regulator [Streptomyces sp. NPDC048514]|uniref:LuxR C-terminal-related transcriptional regulator n=1 Tax=Streptomyces sp. NPDC048514 TaxID=3365564 RepID=UPI003721E91C
MDAAVIAREWPFVARSRQIGEIRSLLASPRAEGCVIHGPGGVGKSRLAEEIWRTAREAGLVCKKAVATAAASRIPLGAIAHLLPRDIDVSDPVSAFRASVRALTGAREERVALWLDDIHLLDTTSAVLVRQLLDSGKAFVIGTFRSGFEANDVTTTILRNLRRFDLEELTLPETGTLLEAALAGRVSISARHHIHAASQGNPLYIREIVLGAAKSGALEFDDGVWSLRTDRQLAVTPGIRELIHERFSTVDDRSREFLESLALCEPLSLSDAQDVLPQESLQDLEAAGLIVASYADRRIALTLSHPLYGEVIRDGISPGRRRELFGAQFTRAQGHGARRSGDALRMASWQLEATGTAEPALLVRAASFASLANDNTQVVAFLAALPEEHATFDTWIMLGNALRDLGDWRRAEDAYASAAEVAGPEAETMELAATRTMNLFWAGAQVARALEVNQEARARVTSGSALAMLDANEGMMRAAAGEPATGLELLSRIPDDYDKELNPALWSICAAWKASAAAATGDAEKGVGLATSALEQHENLHRTHILPHPSGQRISLVHALVEAGRLRDASEFGRRAYAELIESPQPMNRIWLSVQIGRAEWHAGRMEEARHYFAEAVSLARSHGYVKSMRLALSGLAAAAAVMGDLHNAQSACEQAERYPHMGFFAGEERLGEAWLLAADGRYQDARAVLRGAAERAARTGQVMSASALLTDLARLGGAKEAAVALQESTAASDSPFMAVRAEFVTALAEQDAEALMRVGDGLNRLGASLLAAEAYTQAAQGYGRSGEQRRATECLNRAHTMTQRCGKAATMLLETSRQVMNLTAREVEVVTLAVSSVPNREIADRLNLSVRTVENHLQRAYVKLGVKNRRELARVMRTSGFLARSEA